MKHVQPLMLCALVLASVATITQAKDAPKPSQSTDNSSAAKVVKPDRGQQVFVENCSRCHNAPQGFSSRISGTIVRHMRNRASLSDADYKALRDFLER